MNRKKLDSLPRIDGYLSITWRDIYGNKFKAAFNPLMLSDEGYTVFRAVRITGQSRYEPPIMCFIHYDREYVVHRLALHMEDLKEVGFNEIQKVIGEAWHFAKQLEEK